jgi:peptide deformylase
MALCFSFTVMAFIYGILFVDHLSPLRRRLLSGKLSDITKGNVDVDYRMKFPVAKKR